MKNSNELIAKKAKVAFGIFRSRTEAENAIGCLMADGFNTSDISILLPDNDRLLDLASAKNSTIRKNEVMGTLRGGALGGTLGLLLGAVILTLPGAGLILAAGPIVETLGIEGFTAAVGTFWGIFVGFGLSDDDADIDNHIRIQNKILLSVHVANAAQAAKAMNLLKKSGAKEVSLAAKIDDRWKLSSEQLEGTYSPDRFSMNEEGESEIRNI